MKLLFNKDGEDGGYEIKQLMGFMDADFEFANLKADIITATNEMIALIGKPLYEEITGFYTDGADEDQEHLIYLTRYPIAVRAYTLYAPSNDVAHTANGRKMRAGEYEKAPWEWMIDRDNEALEKRYYRAQEDLLIYLEDYDGWKSSEQYKRLNRLFIRSAFQFDEFFRIESRLILLKLEPGISKCEREDILPRIGKEKFDALKAKVKAGEDELEDQELLSLIREACAYKALAWAMPRFSVTLFPEGVLQAYTSDRDSRQIKQPAQNMELQAAKQAFLEDAAVALERIEKLMAPPPEPGCEKLIIPKIITGSKFLST
ncbi:DUF6712 family protein [Flavobacterium rhizosphaerae]|uniref:DUF6712 family protein n=1 Tax=Flavobacterium rhizosphaerae TaxID=3163298 RepID=A0ABW8YXM6_9FLAO